METSIFLLEDTGCSREISFSGKKYEGGLNQGVKFKDVTEEFSPELVAPGLVKEEIIGFKSSN